jgi:hypothetical protein
MRQPRERFAVPTMMSVALVVLGSALLRSPVEASPPGSVSLLQTLSGWQYPGSDMLGGASMSDGGNPLVSSIKCQAVLRTPDPIDKVIAFYSRLTGPTGAGADDKGADAKSVSIKDDSKDRPVTLRVFAVNKADTSTTIVVSRAADEQATHIVWLHYIRFDVKAAPASP